MRTGKELAEKTTEIIIQFKRVPLLLFPEDANVKPNRIVLCIDPDEGLQLQFETRKPGMGMETISADMRFRYGEHVLPDAYERLLLDAIHGDPSLFARSDEIESAWSFVDPIIANQVKGNPELHSYKPGTWGPKEAAEFVAKDGIKWQLESDDKK